MSTIKTERLFYKNYAELDEQLNKLYSVGYRVLMFRESKLGNDFEAWITFKIYD